MRIGNLSGLGTVYTHDGDLILEQGEEIIREVAGDNLLVTKGERRLFSETLLDLTKEKGTLYLTNRRLVFLRTPDEWKKFYTYGNPFGMDIALTEASYARKLKEKGGMEYFDLPYEEVERFKTKKEKMMDIHLRDREGALIRVMLDRCRRDDDKLVVLEELLLEAGAKKLN